MKVYSCKPFGDHDAALFASATLVDAQIRLLVDPATQAKLKLRNCGALNEPASASLTIDTWRPLKGCMMVLFSGRMLCHEGEVRVVGRFDRGAADEVVEFVVHTVLVPELELEQFASNHLPTQNGVVKPNETPAGSIGETAAKAA